MVNKRLVPGICSSCGNTVPRLSNKGLCPSCTHRQPYKSVKDKSVPKGVTIRDIQVMDASSGSNLCAMCSNPIQVGDNIKGYCRRCYARVYQRQYRLLSDVSTKNSKTWQKWYYDKGNAVSVRAKKKIRDAAEKRNVIIAYGGKCVCCGETAQEFMTIDHIFGCGIKDRKIHGASVNLYRHLRHLGYPKDKYRLLCLNCNFSIGQFGYCPHHPDVKKKRAIILNRELAGK